MIRFSWRWRAWGVCRKWPRGRQARSLGSGVILGLFFCCVGLGGTGTLPRSVDYPEILLNSELCRKALEKVGNPNVLVNLVSRRVRQLNSGGAAGTRPLIEGAANMGAADIALTELIEDKMGWELLEPAEAEMPPPKKRRKA